MFIRAAQVGELGFVVDLIAEYALQGHFSPAHRDPNGRQNLITSFSRICENGKLSRATYRGIETVPAEIMLCGRAQKAEGFFIAAGIDNQGGAERELYMLAVAPESRGLGIGKHMADFFCAHYSEHTLHAQCYPASQQMQKMLLNRGFIQYGKTNGGNFLFRRSISLPAPPPARIPPCKAIPERPGAAWF